MSEASVQNRWREFKVTYAQLSGVKLHMSVGDSQPVEAFGLSEALASLLLVNLMAILDEAIALQMGPEDYRACGTLQVRLRWLHRDGMLVDFDELTEVRRRYEGEVPRTEVARGPRVELESAYFAIERQLAAWGLANLGRMYTVRESVGYCRVYTYDNSEMLHTPFKIEPPKDDDVLATFIDVMDGDRIISSVVQRLPEEIAKKVDPVKARVTTYARVLGNRHYDEQRFMSLASYATNAGGVEQRAIDDARERVQAIEDEIGVLDGLTAEASEDANRGLEQLKTMFNAHLGIVKDAVETLTGLPIVAVPVGKAADRV